jgi:imidazoleglycerol phosphate dehydratase HisB
LYTNDHHTLEDTGLGLGEAFNKALDDKRGGALFGVMLAIDKCLGPRYALDILAANTY